MRSLSFLLTLLFSIHSFASGLSAPFSGSRIDGLTRSSTIAEYDSTVDASGNLIDKSGSNYFTYSSQFDNAAWTKLPASASVTADNEPCPVGTNAAELFNEGTVNDVHSLQIQPTIATGSYVLSVYIKYKAAGRAWAYLRNAGAANKNAWFNIQNGTVGTVESLISAYNITSVGSGWYRISIETTDTAPGSTWAIRAASADNTTAHLGDGRGAFWVCGAQLSKSDEWRKGSGVYHATVAANKPLLDLAPTAAPTESKSYLQGADGRRLNARTFNGTTQYYSRAHDASMNAFDNDFTLTVVINPAAANTGTFLGHTLNGTDGAIFIARPPLGYCYMGLRAAASAVSVIGPSGLVGGTYVICQFVRRNNIGIVYQDGVAGSSVDVTGHGVDGSRTLFLGLNSVAEGDYFNGSILYTRIDAEALSDVQLAKEREIIQGTLFGSGNLNPGSTFSRTTTATQAFSDGTLGYVAANIPRVSGDGGGVLIEEQRTNTILQSQTFGTTWTKRAGDGISVDSATILAPDGTATADGIIAEAVNETHYFTQVATTTAAAWILSVWARAGDRNWIYLSNDTVANAYSYFNVANCTNGTAGVGVTLATSVQYANGWCRCSILFTATAALNTMSVSTANADTDNDFAGDGATVNTWFWGAQLELGAHATSYIPTTSVSVTRTADNLTIEPWKVTKPAIGTPDFAMYFATDVYPSSTYSSEVGNYSFLVAGGTMHIESQTLGDYFSFDGTGDYLSLAHGSGGSDFNFTGDFTISGVLIPKTVAASENEIIAKYDFALNGWTVFRNGTDMNISVVDGTGVTNILVAACLVVGQPVLFTATYEDVSGAGFTDNKLRLYVNEFPVASSDASRKPSSNTANVGVGAYGNGINPFNGSIHNLMVFDNYVATQADHDAMYASLKQANILPVKIGTSYEAKKLHIEFEARCAYSQAAEISLDRSLIELSGNAGTASATQNRLAMQVGVDGKPYVFFWDSAGALHYIYLNSALTTWNRWKLHKLYLDLSDLALSTYAIDGTSAVSVSAMTGAVDFDLTDTLLRLGQRYSAVSESNCAIRNLRMRATP